MASFDLAVVGLGYVGLPLARAAVAAGMSVAGLDVAPPVVAGLAAGRSHILGVPDADLAAMLGAGFAPTGDPGVLDGADTVAVCVPTGLDPAGVPDLGPLIAACRTVAAHVRRGTLVTVESTSFAGTTQEIVRPLFEQAGFTVGEDLYLGCSPERIDPGNGRFGIENTPKVVSGCTPLCTKRAAAFYERFVDTVVTAAGTREAELSKLLENTYRAVNIALVNSFAVYCHQAGIDVWDVVRLAGTKPFGFHSLRPGAGVGGHCIPVDPAYLLHGARGLFDFALVRDAQDINAAMPAHIARRAADLLGPGAAGARVVLLGVTYKPDIDDVRESPALGVAGGLLASGARVEYHDPYVPGFAVGDVALPRVHDPYEAAARADLAVLLQAHGTYDLGLLARRSRLLFDTTGHAAGERVSRL